MFDFENDSVNWQKPGFSDFAKIKGSVTGVMTNENGEVVSQFEDKNLIVASGLAWLARVFAGEVFNGMTHMAVGTSATAASTAQTTLVGSELGRVAVASRTRVNNQVTVIATFPAGVATGALNEAGVFDGSSGSTMFARIVFGGVQNKGANDSFQITWVYTFNAG